MFRNQEATFCGMFSSGIGSPAGKCQGCWWHSHRSWPPLQPGTDILVEGICSPCTEVTAQPCLSTDRGKKTGGWGKCHNGLTWYFLFVPWFWKRGTKRHHVLQAANYSILLRNAFKL